MHTAKISDTKPAKLMLNKTKLNDILNMEITSSEIDLFTEVGIN